MSVKWTFEDYYSGVARSTTFYCISAPQTFIVPDDISSVKLTLRGGNGGANRDQWSTATGGLVEGRLQVSPGDVLNIYVGDNGGTPVMTDTTGAPGGYNGGGRGGDKHLQVTWGGYGGGGATDVRYGGTSLNDRVAVAGGGGGSSGGGHLAQAGGYGSGRAPSLRIYQGTDDFSTAGGGGGTATDGGAAGYVGQVTGTQISDGSFGSGGRGADNFSTVAVHGAGGGGGGWYGGGGGGIAPMHMTSSVTIQADYANKTLYAFGGGGGSNYAGGLDTDFNIIDEPGSMVLGKNASPTPHVTVNWTPVAADYTWEINPNDGGALEVQKNLQIAQNTGPNRVNIVQEGQSQAPVMNFSGTILTQGQLETMEKWFDRRVFIRLTDDLGRQYYGIFSQFQPKRVRRASNFWYHTYDAAFTVSAYKNASGDWVYGRTL